jgi:hypothetical protein
MAATQFGSSDGTLDDAGAAHMCSTKAMTGWATEGKRRCGDLAGTE